MSEYLVGFDRFVALEWANFALELSSDSTAESEKKSLLNVWLSSRMAGITGARKTANVLFRMWLEPNSDVDLLRAEARELALEVNKSDRVVFHWGMALSIFPLFREICIHVGRLSGLQRSINRREIQMRVSEKYSNQGTIPRSVDRIFQTLVDWRLLKRITQGEYKIVICQIRNMNAKRWLLEAAALSAAFERRPLNSLYRAPELFPFEMNGEVPQLINKSSRLRIERDGSGAEYVVWK